MREKDYSYYLRKSGQICRLRSNERSCEYQLKSKIKKTISPFANKQSTKLWMAQKSIAGLKNWYGNLGPGYINYISQATKLTVYKLGTNKGFHNVFDLTWLNKVVQLSEKLIWIAECGADLPWTHFCWLKMQAGQTLSLSNQHAVKYHTLSSSNHTIPYHTTPNLVITPLYHTNTIPNIGIIQPTHTVRPSPVSHHSMNHYYSRVWRYLKF